MDFLIEFRKFSFKDKFQNSPNFAKFLGGKIQFSPKNFGNITARPRF